MFRKIRNAFLVAVVLCVAIVPVAQASPVQYVDQIGDSVSRIFDFLDDLFGSAWGNSEADGEDPAEDPPPPSSAAPGSSGNSNGGSGDDGSGDDGSGGSCAAQALPTCDPFG